MSLDRLLAKSYKREDWPDGPPPFALLTQHTRDVVEAGFALVERVGLTALSNAGLPPTRLTQLRQAVVLNSWIQDFGKANSHYQEMVGGKFDRSQLLRHETISGLLVAGDGKLAPWFASVNREIFYPRSGVRWATIESFPTGIGGPRRRSLLGCTWTTRTFERSWTTR